MAICFLFKPKLRRMQALYNAIFLEKGMWKIRILLCGKYGHIDVTHCKRVVFNRAMQNP